MHQEQAEGTNKTKTAHSRAHTYNCAHIHCRENMYRGAETSSSFYQSMRNAFSSGSGAAAGDSGAYNGRATLADIQYRLKAIGAQRAAPTSQSQSTANASWSRPDSSTLLESAMQMSGAAPHRVQDVPSPAPPSVGADDDETLTPAELRSLRMVEIALPVRVLLGELTHPPKPLQLLAEEANLKIFPRHVYISRAQNGAPIAEIVILELNELTEDENKGSLSFFIKKANSPTTTIVEIQCSDAPTRSVMYKIVCAKRAALEQSSHVQQHLPS